MYKYILTNQAQNPDQNTEQEQNFDEILLYDVKFQMSLDGGNTWVM